MARQASALLKEFKMSDLRRMRNLKDGRLHDATVTQKGYETVEIKREEGERFTENGKTYVIEGGIKKRITKFNQFRQLVKIPLFCPCCNKPFVHEIDKRMFAIKQKCLDCNIEFEAKLRKEGKFKEYVKQYVDSNYKSELSDLKQYLIDYANQETVIVNSEGVAEDWSKSKVDVSEIIKGIDDELSEL
jgi:hypothetical protein